MKKLIFPTLCLLFFADVVFAQANYWTLFPQQLDCNWGTFSSIAAPPSSPSLGAYSLVNSAYDKGTGSLLFTVDERGIYNATGIKIKGFGGRYCATEYLKSEIEILPITSECNAYYIMFWEWVEPIKPNCRFAPSHDLIAWRVDVSAGGTITVTNPIILFSDNITLSAMSAGWAGLVADEINPTGSRDIYAFYDFYLVKFTLYPNGTFGPITPVNLAYSYRTGTDLFELAKVNGTDKTIAYAYEFPGASQSFLEIIDLSTIATTGIADRFSIPIGNNGGSDHISGIEYVPEHNYWYVAHSDRFAPGNPGKITVYDGTTHNLIADIPNSNPFRLSDLERAKDGLLYTVGYPGAGTLGDLAYINISTSPAAAISTPTYITTVPGGPRVQIKNRHYYGNDYYLQNQIDIEDYGLYYNAPNKGNGDFVIGMMPRVNPNYSSLGGCPPPQEICQNFLQVFFSPFYYTDPLSYNQKYKITWEETDACGVPVIGSSYVSGPDFWHYGPAHDVDLNTYGNETLGLPSARGKYFVISVEIEDACDPSYSGQHKGIIHITNTDPQIVATWQIKNSASGTSYINPGASCATAPAACGNDPVVRLGATGPAVSEYYLIIKDYGTSCSPGSPTTFDGSASPVYVSPSYTSTIDVNLDSYINNYCGGPVNYFSASNNYIGVQLFTSGGCGFVSLGEQYFINNVGCRESLSANSTQENDLAMSLTPNPTSGKATFSYNMPVISPVNIDVVDLTGRVVLVAAHSEQQQPGKNTVHINTDNLSNGIYQVILRTNQGNFSRRLTVVK